MLDDKLELADKLSRDSRETRPSPGSRGGLFFMGKRPRKLSDLVELMIDRVAARVRAAENDAKLLDDLVKLAKIEKDLTADQEDDEIKEVVARWEPTKDESSKEE